MKVSPSKTPEAVAEYDIEDHELPTFIFIEVTSATRFLDILSNLSFSGYDWDGQTCHRAVISAIKWWRGDHRKVGEPD